MTQDTTRANLELLYNVSRELATSLDLRTVLVRVISLSMDNIGAERGSLIVLDEPQKPVDAVIIYRKKLVAHTIEHLEAILEQGLAGWVVRNPQPVLLSNTSLDKRWLHRLDDDPDRTGPKSAICIPLMARDQLVGVLTLVHPTPGFFNLEHLTLLQSIADLAGIAVNNARLYDSLQAAHRRYRQLFEDSIDPIFLTNWEGQILEANRQAVRAGGYGLAELRQLSVFDLHEAQWDQLGEALQFLSSGNTVSYESRFKSKEGNDLPVQVYVHQIEIEGEHSLQWLLRDISERKALDAMREDLIAMIYHDLRSPLSNIISSLDMLSTLIPLESAPALRPVFGIANRSAGRLQRLISSLLDIHRLEAGQPIIQPKVIDTRALVQEAVENVKYLVDSRKQTLSVQAGAGLPNILADEDIIRRVLTNLLENATKFTPQEGQIIVGGAADGDWVRLWVQDSGAGIPAEAREQIFDKYIRLQAENVPKGLGLGLSFCRLAVKAHGGRIWVESEEGKGSRFIFTIPVASQL